MDHYSLNRLLECWCEATARFILDEILLLFWFNIQETACIYYFVTGSLFCLRKSLSQSVTITYNVNLNECDTFLMPCQVIRQKKKNKKNPADESTQFITHLLDQIFCFHWNSRVKKYDHKQDIHSCSSKIWAIRDLSPCVPFGQEDHRGVLNPTRQGPNAIDE